ncbi:double-stranded RNA-binding type zinc finger domain protein [Metarhizium robertsii]|uniref:Double-stranded RNA-binding type zinc finger domain protein n=2 Tax=Metarhizium robertsii TaxID=568076 RepID=A0A014QUW8_9HYPO|nr:double-stranded RNA-binding type zinc finger domain protein [Metarhizium robertsii]
MYECDSCTRVFYSYRSCEQHMDALDHWAPLYECETCTREFGSWHAAEQHMDALDHWAETYLCETCDSEFYSERAAKQHMQAKGHFKNYCLECDRYFGNANGLRMHLNSNVHRGHNVECPFCRTGYTTASGLSHHLESGSCPKAATVNREVILSMVRKRDPQGTITNKQIEWQNESSVKITYEANRLAWNGSAWECYICHGQFSTINGLNMHLNSPHHKGKIYHCPNKKGACDKEFVSLGGLFNHLESESCSYMRFEKVQKHVSNMFNGHRFIAFTD